MNRRQAKRSGAVCLLLAMMFLCSQPVAADIVAVLFTGFNPEDHGGMDIFKEDLDSRFAADYPVYTFSSQVFAYSERQEAFDYASEFAAIDQLFVVGHSWGGNAVIRLAEEHFRPAGVSVDVTFQIDSVDIFDFGLEDNILPTNVVAGYNYYQIATGLFEPGGEQNVIGAVNINVEELFNDTSITHTSIDNDERLHDLIYSHMQLSLVPEPGALTLTGWAALILAARRRRRLPTSCPSP